MGIMSDFKKLVVPMRFALLMFLCVIASAAPPAPSPIDITQAQAAFAEAEAVSVANDPTRYSHKRPAYQERR